MNLTLAIYIKHVLNYIYVFVSRQNSKGAHFHTYIHTIMCTCYFSIYTYTPSHRDIIIMSLTFHKIFRHAPLIKVKTLRVMKSERKRKK